MATTRYIAREKKKNREIMAFVYEYALSIARGESLFVHTAVCII